MPDSLSATPALDDALRGVLAGFPEVGLAVLFGSMASGRARADSDVDIAVAAKRALSVAQKIALTQALAEKTGRPIDLVDLKTAPEPLLGQIVQHGRRLMGSDTQFGELIYRHLMEQADFIPYQNRVLAQRKMAWIGM